MGRKTPAFVPLASLQRNVSQWHTKENMTLPPRSMHVQWLEGAPGHTEDIFARVKGTRGA